MQQKQLLLLLFFSLVLPLVTTSFPWFNHHHQIRDKRTTTTTSDECCVSSKLNVGSKKANSGRDFFRRLTTNTDSYKEVNPDNMCNLIHFLIQQSSLNNRSVTFTKGMFVIFDSTNQIFEQLMKAKNEQKSGDESKYSGYLNRLKHMGDEAIQKLFKSSDQPSDTFIYVRGDESSHYHGERGSKFDRIQDYPAYGMDIPGACLPSGFGHILFGRLPSISNNGKYAGERLYIKPELFGIRQLKQFLQHAQSYFDHVSRRYVCQIKDMQTKPGCSSEEAFRENTDKNLLNKWDNLLKTIPSISSDQHEQLMKNATTYGIGQIYQQAKQIQSTNNDEKVKDFLMTMIKQYGEDDITVRKGREIIFTTEQLNKSPLTCEFLSQMKKCYSNGRKDCCILPKTYVDGKRANLGKLFFEQLTIKSDIYDEINPNNLCNLIHFLFQQASINNKPITFQKGMFIIFDSSNQIIDRLTSSIKHQQTSNSFNIPDSFSFMNSTLYVGRKILNVASKASNIFQTHSQNSDDRYPTYGIDIPDSCLPSYYDHIIFGELPPFLNDEKYNGRRIFLKVDRFGFEKLEISSALNDVNSFIKQLVKQEFLCRFIKGETKSECIKLQAFKQNTDKDLLNKWKNILVELPSKWKINKQQYKERAIKYGIREIDQQIKDLETLGAGKYVKRFKKFLFERYGQDDIRVRKGQEIILTTQQLKQTYLTCQTPTDIKCKF